MTTKKITDNRLRLKMKASLSGTMKQHLARLAMMMAEERGEKLSYEEALKQ